MNTERFSKRVNITKINGKKKLKINGLTAAVVDQDNSILVNLETVKSVSYWANAKLLQSFLQLAVGKNVNLLKGISTGQIVIVAEGLQ